MRFEYRRSDIPLAISYCCKILRCMSLEKEEYLCVSMSHYQVSYIVLIVCSTVHWFISLENKGSLMCIFIQHQLSDNNQ